MAFLVWFIAVALGLLPAIHHLMFGYWERRREILDYFDDKSIRLYFERFFAARAPELSQRPREQLETLYDQRFGLRTFLLPLLAYAATLMISVAVIVSVSIEPIFGITMPGTVTDTHKAVVYALAGAYLWVVSDLLDRLRQRNIVPSALSAAGFRFIISVPLALALIAIAGDKISPAAAFLLGVFPTATLMLILRRTATKQFGLGDDATASKSELEVIDGINTSLAEKLSEIGVSTILQLAYEDPIQLCMRLNLSFSFVLDVASQALVAMYFSGERYKDYLTPRKFGLRGAIEAADVHKCLVDSEGPEETARVKAMVAAIGAALNMDAKIIEYNIEQIAEDPETELLNNLWFLEEQSHACDPET